jgi:hypothetical protein
LAEPPHEVSKPETSDFVEVEQEVTRPAFDADFIKRVKFQDRGLISQLEGQVLLRNPHIAKLTQQKKWQKKLSLFQDENEVDGVKRINLTTYKSPWLKIYTLLEMGISHFIQPESRWTQETPEAIAFWEQGKDPKIARRIGIEVGDSDVCKYIGRVLNSYGIKREGKKTTLPSGERAREYRPKPLDPICQAIYDCVQDKILALTGEDETVLNWTEIIEKTPSTQAESPSQHDLTPVHIPPIESISHEGICGQSEGEGLIEALQFCESPSDFALATQGFTSEMVEDAIALQDTQPHRRQLRQWWGRLSHGVEVAEEAIAARPSFEEYKPGQEVWAHFPQSQDGWLKGIVEWIRGSTVKVKSGFLGVLIENPTEICPG